MRHLLLLAGTIALVTGLEDPTAGLNAITQDANAKRVEYIKAWLSAANLDPLPEPSAAPKSTKAADALRKLRQTNFALAQARAVLASGGTLEYLQVASPVMFGPILEADALRKAAPAVSADHR